MTLGHFGKGKGAIGINQLSRRNGYLERGGYSNLSATTPVQLGVRSPVHLRPFRKKCLEHMAAGIDSC